MTASSLNTLAATAIIIPLLIWSKCFLDCAAFIKKLQLQNKFSKVKEPIVFKLNKAPCAKSKDLQDSDWINTFSQRSKVSIDYFAEDFSLRGVRATSAVSPTDIVMTVPADSALIVTNNRQPTPFPEFVSPEIWSESLWYHRLAFKLLYSMKAENGPNSWISQLPTSFSTPQHWSATDIAELQYSSLVEKVRIQKVEWREFYERWQQSSNPSPLIPSSTTSSSVSFNSFVWALECVNSRAFSGVYEGSEYAERKRILIFAAGLSVLLPTLQLSSWDQSTSTLVVVAASLFVRDFIFARLGQLKRYVLCPVVDMFNHRSTAKADVSYNYFTNQFEVRIDDGYQAGEQVFISYGKQSNDRLLQFYGFVDADNAYDSYDFGCGIVDLVLAYADEMTEGNPIPLSAAVSAADRLKLIAQAIENTSILDGTDSGETTVRRRQPSTTTSTSTTARVYRTAPAAELKLKLKSEQGQGDQERSNRVAEILRGSEAARDIVSKFDDLSVRALRALYSSADEWETLFPTKKASSNFNLDFLGQPLSAATEKRVAAAMKRLIAAELSAKPTSIEDDIALLKSAVRNAQSPSNNNNSSSNSNREVVAVEGEGIAGSGMYEFSTISAIAFRIEKKRLLDEVMALS